MLISFVIPCYNSENTIAKVVETIQYTVNSRPEFNSEIILVNDNSPDDTWGTIRRLTEQYDNIIGIDLAKNSGQQCAIMAGLRQSKGELVAISDDDGQTPIETVFEFYDKMQEGEYDVVCADYFDRGKRTAFRRMGTWANAAMVKFFLDKPDNITTSVYLLARRFVVDEIIKYNNAYPHMGGLLLRTTYNIGNVRVKQKDRLEGNSGYNLKKLFSTWANGLTTFSIKPLRIATIFGVVMAFVGFAFIVALVVAKFTNDNVTIGWTSMIATTILIGGMIMILLGVIGEYVGRIYLALNENPQYVIRSIIDSTGEKNNLKTNI